MKHKQFIHSFTARSNGRMSTLECDIQLSEGFDPRVDPGKDIKGPFRSLWDTGATNSVVSDKVISELGLKPSGRVVTHGVHGASETDTFIVNVYLPNSIAMQGIKVSRGSLGNIDVLVGMDIICCGDLAITNCHGKTVWSFRIPSHQEIDFVQQHEMSNMLVVKNADRQGRNQTQVGNRRRR